MEQTDVALHLVTEHELAAALSEWDRRWREEPGRFVSEAERLSSQTPETYGEAAAPYLIQILNEQRRAGVARGMDARPQ